MLNSMSGQAPPVPGAQAGAVWIDLDRATPAEARQVAQATGLRVPLREEVAEIETSSRLIKEGAALYLTTPMLSRADAGAPVMAPLGFVVSQDRLLTVRFAASNVVEHFAQDWREATARSGVHPFLGLLEALVDRLADVLEHLGGEMDLLSASLFQNGPTGSLSGKRRSDFLQATLASIGETGARVSQLRDSLLGVGRIVRFVAETQPDWVSPDDRRRLATLDHDVASLNDYDIQLQDRMQFLLDATLGFISIEQNDTIKVLTVVSIVGIPPTFIASMYGMNFHNMPELGWTYGYPYALTLIALSILVPLGIFWRKGWL